MSQYSYSTGSTFKSESEKKFIPRTVVLLAMIAAGVATAYNWNGIVSWFENIGR